MAKVVVTFEDNVLTPGLSVDIDPPHLFTIHPHLMTPAQVVATQALIFIRDNNKSQAMEAAAAKGLLHLKNLKKQKER